MNIDVKNSLESVFTICDTIDNHSDINDTEIDLEVIIVYDIFNFLKVVFKNDYIEIYEDFCTQYLGDKKLDVEIIENQLDSESTKLMSLKYFREMDELVLKEKNVCSSDRLVQMFEIIGKSYLLNGYSNKISMDSYIDYINELREHSTMNQDKQNTLQRSTPEVEKVDLVVDEIETETEEEENNEPSLDELKEELNSLIGLESVKTEVNKIINLINVKKEREKRGIPSTAISLHLVFSGNPGTGKTTVSRLLAQIYKKLGVLSKGDFYEVDRSGLVGGYVGQTAIKTQEVIDKALGGILFIDEAYALTYGKGESDFGQESVDTLLKAMEDHRDDFIVIVAGYPELMEEFINSNPGLRSRFNKYIMFEDYLPEELHQIFIKLCNDSQIMIDPECEQYVEDYFVRMYNERNEQYANGRDVRNYFEKLISVQADRLALLDNPSYDDLQTITMADFEMV